MEGKPLWKLLADMDAEEIVRAIDFRYITDVLTEEEAKHILCERKSGMNARLAQLKESGYPAYTTSAGWFGVSDKKMLRLCDEAAAEG